MNYETTAEDRFWNKVDKTSGCWLWTAAKNANGYGVFSLGGKNILAHRVSCSLVGRQVPDGLDACHTCDNPSCVNPDHIFFGTHRENMLDSVSKGRDYFSNNPEHNLGSKNGMTELSENDVKIIRSRVASGETQTAVARDYGMSQTTISLIVLRKTWQHV